MLTHTSLLRAVVLLLAIAPSVAAQGWIVPRPCRPPRCPPPCRMDRPCPVPMPGAASVSRLSSDVRVELVDRVLRFEVEEVFINRGGVVGEADYLFPLPKGAAFEDLKLSINGELVAGETMNAADARRIYEDIVRQQKDPALVEWMGYGLLRTRIFPIAPGERKKVVVRFQSVAEREGDALRVDYFRGARLPETPMPVPMRRGRDDADDRRGNLREGASAFTLVYPAGGGLGAAYSPTHSLESEIRGGRRHVTVRGDARDVTLLVPVRRVREPSIALLAHAPGREDGFALITLTPPIMRSARIPRDLTFVMDVSGSMAGEKIRQARAAGRQFLVSLREDDRFRMIDFSSDVRSFRDDFVQATPANLAAARDYVDALDASGSTNISGALEEALAAPVSEGRLPIVLFMTDGEPTVGERSPDAIARLVTSQRGRRRIFTFGLGADLNITLLERLALDGEGAAHFVRPNEDVERAVAVVSARLTNPVVTDLRVRVDGVRVSKLHPSGAADLFAGQDLVLLARYDGSGSATLRFEGRTADGPVSWTERVEFPERSRANPFVGRLWATQRIGWLSAEKRRDGGSSEVDEEIRALGERFGIPTEFSSYLVLEPGMVAQDGSVRRMDQRTGNAMGTSVGTSVAPAAVAPQAAARMKAFESARDAVAMRGTTSLATADAFAEREEARGGGSVRRAGDRLFALRDSVWTDMRASGSLPRIAVQPYTAAYFELLKLVPELGAPFALGDRVLVSGRRLAIEVSATGRATLSDEDRARVASDW